MIRKWLVKFYLLLSILSYCRCRLFKRIRHPLKLSGFCYCHQCHKNVLRLRLVKNKTIIKISFKEVLQQPLFLTYLCSFDLILILLLAKEAKLITSVSATYRQLRKGVILKTPACINSHFYSEHTRHEMLVVTVPDTNMQLCLSVKELVNNKKLLKSLRTANASNEERFNNSAASGRDCFLN